MKRVRLYYQLPSHYCEKARAILAYKRIPFQLVYVPEGDHSAVLEASGQDYVPYLELQGGKGVTWSHIADWAERVKPKPTIFPGPSRMDARGESRVVEHWAHKIVEDGAWNYALPDLVNIFKDPKERWIFIELQEAKRGPIELLKQRRSELHGALGEVCALSEGLLAEKPFLLGNEPSLADFALYGALHPLKVSGNKLPRRFRKLRRWHQRMIAIAK